MAEIIVSVDELVHILKANNMMPPKVRDIEAYHQGISFKIKTGLFPLMLIRIVVKFTEYADDCAVFEVVQNPLMKKFDWLIHKWIESMQMPEHIRKIEYPAIHIDVNGVLAQQLKGVRIKNISFESGLFYAILTEA